MTALGAVRLAHVDLVSARGLERVFGALAGAGRAIYLKDVALTHRRWPLFGLGSAVCVACLWGSAFARNQVGWATAGVVGIVVLAALLALTLVRPPTEPPRILPVLPIPRAAATRAKAILVLWRIVWPLALGALAYLARAAF